MQGLVEIRIVFKRGLTRLPLFSGRPDNYRNTTTSLMLDTPNHRNALACSVDVELLNKEGEALSLMSAFD